MDVFSCDRIEAMHEASLDIRERLGIRVLLPEARTSLTAAGALLNGDNMVHIGRKIVEGGRSRLRSAPGRRPCRRARA